MNIGILGDLHARFTRPSQRIDDYYTTQFEKLDQAFSFFVKKKCSAVIQPGDFFNSYGRDPYLLVYDIISFLKKYNLPLFLVFGQHDLRFHNLNATNTPISVLVNTELVHKLDNETPTEIEKNVFLYGVNLGERIPRKVKKKKALNILCMHKMVIRGKKLWPGQTDYMQARRLPKVYPFDLFICGDNHESFVYENKVINCGSLCRMRVDQEKHQPIYGVYNTEKRTLESFKYKIKQNVLRVAEHEIKKEELKDTEEFKKSLHSDFEGELDFRSNVETVMKKKRRIRKRTKQIIEEALND